MADCPHLRDLVLPSSQDGAISNNCSLPSAHAARLWPPRAHSGRGRVVIPLLISGEGILDQVRHRFCSWISYLIGPSTTVALIVDSNIGLHSEWRDANAAQGTALNTVLRELKLHVKDHCGERLPPLLQRAGWMVVEPQPGGLDLRGTLLLRVWDLPRKPWSHKRGVGNGSQIRSATQWLWEYKHATRWYVQMLADDEPLLRFFDFFAKVDADVLLTRPMPFEAQDVLFGGADGRAVGRDWCTDSGWRTLRMCDPSAGVVHAFATHAETDPGGTAVGVQAFFRDYEQRHERACGMPPPGSAASIPENQCFVPSRTRPNPNRLREVTLLAYVLRRARHICAEHKLPGDVARRVGLDSCT